MTRAAHGTEISGEEIGSVDLEDLIPEETMVVTISTNGYISRTRTPTSRLSCPATATAKA